jgi:pimeloyl-ACP methyl ester carboxylesterase
MTDWRLGRRASVGQGEVAWECVGEGPPIVLVHGTPSWSFLWRNVVPVLAQQFRVYVLDLLGYGESERHEGQDMSITAQGRMLAELLRQWGLDNPGLVGHDIGGATVLRAHLVEGRPASRIALVDAVALNPWNTPTTMHIRSHLDCYRTMPPRVYEEIVKAHLRTAVHKPLTTQTLAAYLAPWQGDEGQSAYFRKIAQWTQDDVGALEPLLRGVSVPVRIIWGKQDRWLDCSVAHRLQGLLPGSQLQLIPGAGHFSPEDAPAEVADALLEFFAAM